jgi:REP-associated tyrosine transposase
VPSAFAPRPAGLASAGVARQPRRILSDGTFHVTARACFDQPLFRDDDDRRVFLFQLRRLCARFGIELLAYCLMGTHYHLLLHGGSDDLAAMMQRLNGGYAHHVNDRHRRRGHVFGQRYSARAVLDDRHLEEVWRYIEQNAVTAGLCRPGEKWRWMWLRPLDASSGQAGGLSH